MLKINKINLFIASIDGHEKIVKLLIDAGSDLNIKTNSGQTVLHIGESYFNYCVKNK